MSKRGRLSSVKPKELRDLYQAAEELGCVLEPRASHWRITRPGYPGHVTGPSTASEYRGIANTRAQIRRVLGLTDL
jgi:hypothetical protein